MSNINNNINSIVETVKGMSAIELMDLVRAIEETFGVSAAIQFSGVAAATDSDDQAAVKEEKTSFKVVIKDVGANTINVIKALRLVVSGLGLKEAKDMAVAGAVVKEDANKEEAEKIKKALLDAGASVDVV